ncbi:MAG: hypothetical protein LBG71_05460 [Clostridiales Family XIII bacterium]|jgi:hypothetical protein|nr:hypothetical protein [Clostridiales Family XIII bacterium]
MDIIQSRKKLFVKTFVSVALFVIIVAIFAGVASGISERSGNEGVALTYESLRRAAVQCYALEGTYPADFAYLKEHYGVRPDERKYVIYYDYVASNLMPDITVLPAGRISDFMVGQ